MWRKDNLSLATTESGEFLNHPAREAITLLCFRKLLRVASRKVLAGEGREAWSVGLHLLLHVKRRASHSNLQV